MDIDIKDVKNARYYKYSESGIKLRNYDLWQRVINYVDKNISFKEKFYLYENNMFSIPLCECGSLVKFIDMKNGYRKFCSRKCMINSDVIKEERKKTCQEKYGVDNPSKLNDVKDLVKRTNNIKFGVDYPLQSDVVKNKNIEHFIDKYGVDNPSKLSEIRMKARQTTKNRYGFEFATMSDEIKNSNKKYFIEKYGVDNPFKLPEVRMKAKQTTKNKYGVEFATMNDEIKQKIKYTNIKKYGKENFTQTEEYKKLMMDSIFSKNSELVNNDNYKLLKSNNEQYTIFCKLCNNDFVIQRQLWRNRINRKEVVCLKCNPIVNNVSFIEKEILSFIKNNYDGSIIENYRDVLEIDIYLPDLKIGFEFNGLWWHSELNKEKSYHSDKYYHFKNLGIDTISIWEDEWLWKEAIVKSMILNKLNKTKNKIYARKCELKVVDDNKLVRDFLEKNHIQGFVGSKIKIGLYYNDSLVSLMTFGNLRTSLGQKGKSGSYELLRFCNQLNTNVVGGASKLLKFFIKNFNPSKIITYSLNSYSNGDLYNTIGFKFDRKTVNNYFWVKNKIRYHRFSFRKDKLVRLGYDKNLSEVEIMYSLGYFRVFDSGSKKWYIKFEQGDGI